MIRQRNDPQTEEALPNPRDPFRQALDDLRARAMSGLYAPGRAVVIVEEARRLRLSTTPVREALAWLCGEGLMERAPRAGYLAPRLDAALLRDRLWVRSRCLTTALELTADIPPRAGLADDDDQTVAWLFHRIIGATGNRALAEVYARVDSQLRLLGDAEAGVFGDIAAEAERLLQLGRDVPQALAAGIDAYHQRRIESAALIVLEVQRAAALAGGGAAQ